MLDGGPTLEEWTKSVSDLCNGRVIDNYVHDWELKYWWNVGYTPSQIAYVIQNRPDDYLKKNPWWVRPE